MNQKSLKESLNAYSEKTSKIRSKNRVTKKCFNWFLMRFKPIITMHSKVFSLQTLPSFSFLKKLILLLRLYIRVTGDLKLIV